MFLIKQSFNSGNLNFYEEQSLLQNKYRFNDFLTEHYEKEWIVYCKPPFKNASSVVEYLGRYTHRVAIFNSRIVSIDTGIVSFKWRDYKDNSKWKVMTLPADEFIRRFLIHILPQGFMKIRHYGFLGNRNRKTKLLLCQILTNTIMKSCDKLSAVELIIKLTGKDITKCPICGSANISRRDCDRSPPSFKQIS